jgi:hypothetical protein
MAQEYSRSSLKLFAFGEDQFHCAIYLHHTSQFSKSALQKETKKKQKTRIFLEVFGSFFRFLMVTSCLSTPFQPFTMRITMFRGILKWIPAGARPPYQVSPFSAFCEPSTCPPQLTFREKLKWSLVSLLTFLVFRQIPIFGVRRSGASIFSVFLPLSSSPARLDGHHSCLKSRNTYRTRCFTSCFCHCHFTAASRRQVSFVLLPLFPPEQTELLKLIKLPSLKKHLDQPCKKPSQCLLVWAWPVRTCFPVPMELSKI